LNEKEPPLQINFGARSVSCKIVYYGPGLSGKTTNIQKVHDLTPGDRKGDLTSIKTEGDRTLFFDYMSFDLGKVAGMDTRFQIYTVPGQVYYNATRKLVLSGADGVVFVADSSPDRMQDNLDSWRNLQDNLAERGINVREVPLVLQWNKRDVSGAVAVEELNRQINTIGAPAFEAVACNGDGVLTTLKAVCAMVCKTLNARQMKTSDTERTAITVSAASPFPAGAAEPVSALNMSFASRRTGLAGVAPAIPASESSSSAAVATLETDAAPMPPRTRPLSAPNREPAPTPPKARMQRPAVMTATSRRHSQFAWKLILTVGGIVAATVALLGAALHGLGIL
jgi:signal recognition particle receptor subunit beta